MGLMDKVKQGAEQALSKAQQGMSQGKAKIDSAQARHQWDGLLRNLGAAVYAEQRQGGPSTAVASALAVLDQHAAEHGAVQSAGPDADVEGGAEGEAEGGAEGEADEAPGAVEP